MIQDGLHPPPANWVLLPGLTSVASSVTRSSRHTGLPLQAPLQGSPQAFKDQV